MLHSINLPIEVRSVNHAFTDKEAKVRKTNGADEDVMEPRGYLRVPVWVILLFISIGGGVVCNLGVTVYWAATFKQSFADFKDDTYKQKTEHMEAEILRITTMLKAHEDREQAELDVITKSQTNLQIVLAQKGLLPK